MATLVLTAVGTLVGGPIGGAIGALAGRAIDGAVIAGGRREGPRLKDLAITTSSYGNPIPRHHGRMRAAGTIIWATELVEHKEKSGGGKGKPKTTSYSYTTSFAVALASRPIVGIGRIWADGGLLRGAAGDLKVGGSLRVHTGHGDQAPDSLLASAEAQCPAYRGLAYAVFEDLALADFGNRIPALTFEVVADEGSISLVELLGPDAAAKSEMQLQGLAGYSNEGGPLLGTLETIDSVYPLACDAGGAALTIASAEDAEAAPILLPDSAAGWEPGDFGEAAGRNRRREGEEPQRPEALRYYDTGRDFQPGLQRTAGRPHPGRVRTIEFPGALPADGARALANAAAQRAGWRRETLLWRVAELNPAIAPGSLVRAPGIAGSWQVAGWEWRERGLELELVRRPPVAAAAPAGDVGQPWIPPDLVPWRTRLRAFGLPWDGYGDGDTPKLFAAASAGGSAWGGAALYVDRGGELVRLGETGRTRSTVGATLVPLSGSPALVLERHAALEVELAADDMSLASAGPAALATGANRLLVGDEVLQFARAEQVGERLWRLSGLLRGRGGTEAAAVRGHDAGASIVLIDDSLVPLDPALVPAAETTGIAAIGFGDEAPVTAPLTNPGAGRKPLCPVHPRAAQTAEGLELGWTRRARGAWDWPDEVETPLVEQGEAYRVGCGPVDAPFAVWSLGEPRLVLDGTAVAALAAAHPGSDLWVRQVGSFAQSDPLLLTTL